ncbi:glycogen synthase GlgA [Caldalkalibacillus mannanilyticus]|uniref:glycogen synthase GlgA n=1 Tax=Caldalkalibacillus mannanilyticus TaxID=1418 RepID=UPI000551B827|nr:glycogen synthase GlgA [Caldalkalibacillus mannanilyticus]
MNVLFVATEAVPFIKTGGLADVIGSLPKELVKLGVNVRVLLPKYSTIPEELKKRMTFRGSREVQLGWRKQYCGIWEIKESGVHFYFIDNEYYFKRDRLYGYYDEAERFAYYCRAVVEVLPELGFHPEIIHCHDWQTGLIPLFIKAQYSHLPFYQAIRTVFTIHNLQYQGIFPSSILSDLLHLDASYFTPDKLEFYGNISYMKAGLLYSDILTTVSQTYAFEIKTPYYGERLDGLLRARDHVLHGIVNGIDYESFNPETDPLLFHYSSAMEKEEILKAKQANKAKLQENLGLPISEEIPLLAMVTRLVSQKGLDLIERVMEEMLALDLQLVILGTGDPHYEQLFLHMASKYPDKVSAQIMFDDTLARRIYAGADQFLMPSKFEPCGIGQLIALRYGTIPIVRETGGLNDTVQAYNEYTEEGNGFSFAHYNAHDMLYTISRALEFYHDPEVWERLVIRGMNQDFSWRESASQYYKLYQ